MLIHAHGSRFKVQAGSSHKIISTPIYARDSGQLTTDRRIPLILKQSVWPSSIWIYWDIGANTLISSIWINIGISGKFTPMIPLVIVVVVIDLDQYWDIGAAGQIIHSSMIWINIEISGQYQYQYTPLSSLPLYLSRERE